MDTKFLISQIEEKRKEIHSDAYPMSIGEIANLYRDGELDIHPEFQRQYRWTETQKTKLIESILLGIPLPSFFISQREDGIWDLVDGLQRLSTIFSFMGIYKNENDEVQPALKLRQTEYLPGLENLYWDDKLIQDHQTEYALPKDIQLAFKREKIDLKIIKKESDKNTKYELFHRLNTFGSSLSPQEIRNCLLIMVNKRFYDWMLELSNISSFRKSISSISDRSKDEKFDLELIVRFLVLKDKVSTSAKELEDVHDFLTQEIIHLAENEHFDFLTNKEIFEKTFDILAEALNEDAFRKFDGQKYTGGFSLSIFEILSLGLAQNISMYSVQDNEKVLEISKTLKDNPTFKNYSKSGTRASSRLPYFLPEAKSLFQK